MFLWMLRKRLPSTALLENVRNWPLFEWSRRDRVLGTLLITFQPPGGESTEFLETHLAIMYGGFGAVSCVKGLIGFRKLTGGYKVPKKQKFC